LRYKIFNLGNYLASGSKSGTGFIWQTETTQRRRQILSHLQQLEIVGESSKELLNNHSQALQSSPGAGCGNKQRLDSAKSPSILFNQPAFNTTMMLVGHAAELSGISFSPRGCQLVTCSDDSTMRIWVDTDDFETEYRVGIKGMVEFASSDFVNVNEENVEPDLTIRIGSFTDCNYDDTSTFSDNENLFHSVTSVARPVHSIAVPPLRLQPKSPNSAPICGNIDDASRTSSSKDTPNRSAPSTALSSSSKTQTNILSFFSRKQ
jgi:WD40 repeat protein